MTTTSTASEAVVTTLTAEVRTLVVGTRQVTLSVAKQLDIVPLVDLTVMGRVHLSDDRYVIGAAPDGTLALARYQKRWYPSPRWITADDLTGKATVCQRLTPDTRDDYYRLAIDGWDFRLTRDATEQCTIPGHERSRNPVQECHGWTAPSEVMAQIRTAVKAIVRAELVEAASHKAAAAAPLIVLAGLK